MLCLTLAIQRTVARQVPLSIGLSRQEYWSGLPLPSPGDLPDLGIESASLDWQVDSLPLSQLGSPDDLRGRKALNKKKSLLENYLGGP